MGAWGTAIFSDDYTSDIKREYQTLLAFGIPKEEALKKTMEYFNVSKEEYDCRFWFAIASIQVRYKFLEKDVADFTVELINNGGDIDEWEEDRIKRYKVLEKLKQQLVTYDFNDGNDRKIKIPKPKVYKAKWKVGDILSYRLINYKLKPFYNMYIGLQIVNIRRTPISKIMPELVFDEWMEITRFDYLDKKKPSMDELIKRGYCPIHRYIAKFGEYEECKTFNTITFDYHPYKGDLSKYDPAKTCSVLYDIELLGNQKDLNYPAEMLERRSGMYSEIEFIMSQYPEFSGEFNT